MSGNDEGSLQVSAHCICGGALTARSTPPQAAMTVRDTFWRIHVGDGHRPCDARTATNARRRIQRETQR